MPINWQTVEQAIRTAVKAGTGLADAAVYFSPQDGARGDAPFVTIRLGGAQSLGSVDEVQETTDLTQVGSEIETKVVGQREFSVSIQCFTPKAVKDDSAKARLSRLQTYLSLPSVVDTLANAGLSVYDLSEVREISTVLDTKFEGRAILELRCYVAETATERIGYIDEVEFKSYMGPPDSGTKENMEF